MSVFEWFYIFNLDEFLSKDIPIFQASVIFEGYGEKTVTITRGAETGVMIDDVFMILNMNGRNPFRYGERALLLDDDGDVWIGIYKPDEN